MPPPQLPTLSEFYTNTIFSNQHSPDPDVPSFDRLVFIGENAVQFGIMQWLQGRYTTVSANSLKRKLNKKLESKPNAWGRLYKLRSFCPISSFSPQPSVHSESTPLSPPPPSTPMEHRSHGYLFCAYVGGLLLEYGGECTVTNQWIKEIFEYELDEGSAESSDENEFFSSPSRIQSLPRPKYISPSSSSAKNFETSPLARNTVPNGNGNSINNTNPVSLLNELAAKKNHKVSWEEISTGPSHLSEWTSKLKLSEWSEEYVGTGLNKKMARAAAAELALRDAGWVSNVLSDPESQSQ